MEFYILSAAVVGAVWLAVILWRGGLLAGGLCVLFAGTCCGYAAWHITVQPVPVTADRILWIVLMLQLIFSWRLGMTASRRFGRPELLLVAFIGVLLVSVVTHDWTVGHSRPVSQFVFFYLMPMGLYFAGMQARITERGMKTMFVLCGLFGLYLALTAIAERRELTALVFPRYIMTDKYLEFLGRSRGPLLNPAGNGMLLGTCLAAGLMLWPRMPRWGKLALMAYLALLGVGIFYTMTRGAWMGGGLALFLLVAVVLPRIYRPWFVALATVCSLALVVNRWADIVEFKRDKNLSARLTATSAELRPVLAAVAWEMFRDRPLAGCGLGHYRDEHIYYLANRKVDVPLEQGREYVQHDVWLSLLTETGLMGATLFTLLMAIWLHAAWRLWRTRAAPLWMRQEGLFFIAVVANYVMNGLFHDMTIIPMVHMILFFLAGVTVNLQSHAAECAVEQRQLEPGAERVYFATVSTLA